MSGFLIKKPRKVWTQLVRRYSCLFTYAGKLGCAYLACAGLPSGDGLALHAKFLGELVLRQAVALAKIF